MYGIDMKTPEHGQSSGPNNIDYGTLHSLMMNFSSVAGSI